MFNIGDTVVYKGHGLVKVVGIPKSRFNGIDSGEEIYYMLKSARTPLSGTKLLVKVDGAAKVLRYPITIDDAKGLIALLEEESAELPEDHMERMRILDEIADRNDWKELAALVRDYRESRLLNLDRVEITRIKSIARNLAEEICYVLKVNRPALKGKLSIRSTT
jgi:RNA polymerase-interacting CarD/CdnL/TRCF family regulator